MNIVLTVGDLVLPLCCKRCGFRVVFIVGDDESEGRAAADMGDPRRRLPGRQERAGAVVIQVPWKRPSDAYTDDGPENEVIFRVGAVTFVVTPTRHSGINTGRTRYRVACATCGVVVHDATTGPAHHVENHIHDSHWST